MDKYLVLTKSLVQWLKHSYLVCNTLWNIDMNATQLLCMLFELVVSFKILIGNALNINLTHQLSKRLTIL